MKPPTRLRVVSYVGKHTLDDAKEFIHQVKARSDGRAPLLFSDELRSYAEAVLAHYSTEEPPDPKKKRGPGRPRKYPKRVVDPHLRYAQVHKQRKKNRVVKVTRQIIFSTAQQIQQSLNASGCGNQINTSHVERDNLNVRHSNGRTSRKVLTFSKDWHMLERHTQLDDAYYNFVRPHRGLRKRVRMTGRKWQQRTPAMAEGITDHVWTLEELFTYIASPKPN